MLHPAKAGIRREAAEARNALKRMARPSGEFDAQRYFRGDQKLAFYNVGTTRMRDLARSIYRVRQGEWTVDDAAAFADLLIKDPHLEVKSVGIEVLARYRRALAPRHLSVCKRWLVQNYSSNWATTDAICGFLIGPLVVAHPPLARRVGAWARSRNMWVRRASAVGLIQSVRKGAALDVAYDVARALYGDREDLIHKATGWMLREVGKTDERRLERHLRKFGPAMPRTTVRYAIERMKPAKRRALLRATHGQQPLRHKI